MSLSFLVELRFCLNNWKSVVIGGRKNFFFQNVVVGVGQGVGEGKEIDFMGYFLFYYIVIYCFYGVIDVEVGFKIFLQMELGYLGNFVLVLVLNWYCIEESRFV